VPATQETAAYDYVTQLTDAGVRRRQVLFRKYSWTQRYTFEASNPVGGDNVRSIAQGLQAMCAARVFGAGATQVTASRKSFCKALDGYAFEVGGTTQSENTTAGESARVYGYVVRGKSQACYAVLVYVYGKDDSLGPEMENLIASLHESEK